MKLKMPTATIPGYVALRVRHLAALRVWDAGQAERYRHELMLRFTAILLDDREIPAEYLSTEADERSSRGG